jgi:hypothetical protein
MHRSMRDHNGLQLAYVYFKTLWSCCKLPELLRNAFRDAINGAAVLVNTCASRNAPIYWRILSA